MVVFWAALARQRLPRRHPSRFPEGDRMQQLVQSANYVNEEAESEPAPQDQPNDATEGQIVAEIPAPLLAIPFRQATWISVACPEADETETDREEVVQEESDPDEEEASAEHFEEPVQDFPQQTRRMPVWAIVVLCVVIVVVISGGLGTWWWFGTTATVTITPTHQAFTTTFPVSQTQVTARTLPALTLSQQRTVATTGQGNQPAEAATGWLTLYNTLPVAQTIPAGTTLAGKSGVVLVLLETVPIDAATPPEDGIASKIKAQALAMGPGGNIAAQDLQNVRIPAYPSVLATNPGAFSGGTDAYTYSQVAPKDINAPEETLKASIAASTQAAEAAQLHPGESLIQPLHCSWSLHTDNPVGAAASSVTVQVTETCQGTAYNTVQMQQAGTTALQQRTPSGYGVANLGTLTVTQGPTTQTFQVQITANLVWQWTDVQLRWLAGQLAGKTIAQANAFLDQTQGVQDTHIALQGHDTGTLPGDPSRIQVSALLLNT